MNRGGQVFLWPRVDVRIVLRDHVHPHQRPRVVLFGKVNDNSRVTCLASWQTVDCLENAQETDVRWVFLSVL